MDAKYIAIGLLALGFLGAALGVAKVFAAGIDGISRNPSAENKISKYIFVGAGLSEAMGLFALVMMLLVMFL